MARVWLGFGGNLGDVRETLRRVEGRLVTPDLFAVRRAGLYRTAPIGPPGQPDYINTVIEAETMLGPETLLDRLKHLEVDLGRVPSERWGARVVDLDILMMDKLVYASARLQIPHVRLAERAFVLKPLAELQPELVIPGLRPERTVRQALAALPDQGVARIALGPVDLLSLDQTA